MRSIGHRATIEDRSHGRIVELRESTVPASVVPIKPQFPAKELAIPISAFCLAITMALPSGEGRAAVKPTD
jgi:hypothetical protein